MINKQLGLKLSAVTLAVLLASCGGGGGYYGDTGSSSPGKGNPTNPSTGEEVQALTISNISLVDPSGEETETISTLGAIATVKVIDAKGKPVSGALVAFSGENMTFSTTNSSVFTNVDGEASIGVLPTNANVTGAYIITATSTLGELTAKITKNVSFVKSDIAVNEFAAASSLLVSGGSTLLTLVTQDSNGNYQNNQEVRFSAACGSFSNQSVVSASEGNVSNTYYAYDEAGKLCSGMQQITAIPTTSPNNAKNISVDIQAATAT